MIGISALRWQLREMLHQLRKGAEGAFHALLPGTARKAFRDGTAPNIFVSRTRGLTAVTASFRRGVWIIIVKEIGLSMLIAADRSWPPMWCCSRGSGSAFFSNNPRTLPKIKQSPIRRRASKPQSQDDLGLPRGRVRLPGGKLVSILQWSAPCRSDQSCTAIDLILRPRVPIGKRRGGLAARLIWFAP